MAAPAATSAMPGERLIDHLAHRQALDPAWLLRLAACIHRLHAAAQPAPRDMARVRALAMLPEQAAELERHRGTLDARAALGRVVRGHGALRLDAIGIVEGKPVLGAGSGEPIDLLLDLASLLADLWHAGFAVEANALANRYVDVHPQGASGWALLPLFLSLRTGDAGLAAQLLAPISARVIAVGGLSGTGKSTLSRLIGGRIGRPPGARVLRSDVFRKRVMGLPPEHRLPPRHYTRRSDEQTFEAMFETADDHLAQGTSVVLDAVFMSRFERDVAEALADRARVPFTGIWLEAPERDRIARVAARSGDASDATVDVARSQSHRPVGALGGWHRMRVNRPIELIVAAARAILEKPVR